jgi:glycosyltransferase involved in cell wall biosynthesis
MTDSSTQLAVSVVIPTHNPRADYLARVLDVLRRQTLSKDLWELVIVDNGSRVPLKAASKRPKDQETKRPKDEENCVDLGWHRNAKIVREERLGLTFARLRGIAEAKSELIVWVDDDNVLDPNYLSGAVEAFELHPRLGAAGGKSVPEYEVRPPDWYDPSLVPLGIRDLGEVEIFMRWGLAESRDYPAAAPIGAGMVTRKKALARWAEEVQADARRLKLGRTGSSLASGEDNDINLTLLSGGWELAYLPQLCLTHLIAAKRLGIEYCRKLGRASFRDFVGVLDKHGIRPWTAIPKWTLPLRAVRDWWRVKPWQSPRRSLEFWGHVGMYEGRAALPRVGDR